MSRTNRIIAPYWQAIDGRVIQPYWRKEKKSFRKVFNRGYRKLVNGMIRDGNIDNFPIVKGTQGWLTW